MSGVMQVIEARHRGYLIKAAMMGKSAAANVIRNGNRHRATGATVDEAIVAAKAWIDAEREENFRNRTRCGEWVIGSQADFEHALQTVRIGPEQLAMLKAHYRAPDRTLSAGELARAAGYSDYSVANSLYGRLGAAFAEAADLPPPSSDARKGEVVWTGVLARDAGRPNDSGHFLWRMHDPLADAMRY